MEYKYGKVGDQHLIVVTFEGFLPILVEKDFKKHISEAHPDAGGNFTYIYQDTLGVPFVYDPEKKQKTSFLKDVDFSSLPDFKWKSK